MSSAGKTIIVTKVYDDNCDICKHMSRHDRATFESFSEIGYQEVLLDEVINPGNSAKPLTLHRIYQCLEKYALNPDYTIDLPVYVFLTKQGQYKGHIIGSATVSELREKIKEVVEPSVE